MNTILITGSTGKVGSAVVTHLARKQRNVRAASRHPLLRSGHAGLQSARFDFMNPSTFDAALQGVDTVFLIEPQPATLPAHVVMFPFIQAATQRGCRLVLLSSASVAFQQEPLGLVEEAVRRAPRHTILRATWFLDNFHTWWADPIRTAGVLPLPAGEARTPFLYSNDIGEAIANVLATDSFHGETLHLLGNRVHTHAEVADAISQAAGRTVAYAPITEEDFTQSMREVQLPEEAIEYLLSLYRITREGCIATLTDDLPRILNRPATTLQQYAAQHAEAWR